MLASVGSSSKEGFFRGRQKFWVCEIIGAVNRVHPMNTTTHTKCNSRKKSAPLDYHVEQYVSELRASGRPMGAEGLFEAVRTFSKRLIEAAAGRNGCPSRLCSVNKNPATPARSPACRLDSRCWGCGALPSWHRGRFPDVVRVEKRRVASMAGTVNGKGGQKQSGADGRYGR